MTDYIDKLTHTEPEGVQDTGTINALGIRVVRAMAVPARAVSSAEIDEWEAEDLRAIETALPIPFWDGDTGMLEPLMTGDLAALAAAGIDPVDWEIAVLEDHMQKIGVQK